MNKEKIIELEFILKNNREKIINILITYESYETALYEINNSINFLKNLKYDKDLNAIKVKYSSIFLPINLPLYSLMLFVTIPCIISQEVFLRLPKLTSEILLKIYKILQIKKIFPNLLILEMERALFLEKYVRQSNIIIFTGKYENAIKIKNKCSSHSLFLFSGTGINPILITKSANINQAVKKTITMRVFNSGQDCAAPNIILVHNQIKNKFIKKLISSLKNISIGDYKKRRNRIGKLIDINDLLFIGKIFKRLKEKIIYGGICNYAKSIIYPTVIVDLLKNKDINFIEFFSPIFYILIYKNDKDLNNFFLNKKYLENAMYISIFEKNNSHKKIHNSIVLNNKIVLDIDDGNSAYGGYGPKVNFISFNNEIFHRPILISKEIKYYLKKQSHET